MIQLRLLWKDLRLKMIEINESFGRKNDKVTVRLHH